MAVAGSQVSACDPLPFLMPFWLWKLHNTLYLSSTASPSSLLSSRAGPRPHESVDRARDGPRIAITDDDYRKSPGFGLAPATVSGYKTCPRAV